MGKIIFIFILLLFCSCEFPYKYKIVGKVNTEKGLKEAIWYTDTICFNEDTAYYQNSDSSIVKIYPPYEITKFE